MQAIRVELRKLLEPGVSALGFELVDVEMAGSHHHATLRVYIDSPRGVNVDDCARVSRQLSALLDVEDPLPGHYTLEVSSPGLDRPLAKPEDFKRFVGETIKVKMHEPLQGRKNFSGKLVDVAADHVVVEVDKESFNLAFDDMERARLVPQVLSGRRNGRQRL
ncbi:MAG: ribosome maturation factor RimP [Sulfuricaulis sp.]|nr:ribosome maturation factor RimP [Sulfuricaulis sp.]